MSEIPPKPKKLPKYHCNLKMTKIPLKLKKKNTKLPKTNKMTKIPPKPKKCPKYPRT